MNKVLREWNKLSKIIVLAMFLGAITVVCNAQFAGGDGSEEDPFQVATVEHLNLIRTNYLGQQHTNVYFEQTGHIDVGGVANWDTIGDGNNRFFGNYNGAGFEIRNLRRSTRISRFGFFGVTQDALLENIHLRGVDISVNSLSGTLVAEAHSTVIRYCSIVGRRRFINAGQGGMVAQTSGNTSFFRCWIDMELTDQGSGGRCGGIVGVHNATGEIAECFVLVDLFSVGANDPAAAGMVARLSNGSIRDSYVIGQIETRDPRGRLGGLVGDNSNRPIVNSFAIVSIETEGPGPIGGLIAQGGAGAVENSYWNTDLTAVMVSPGGGEPLTTGEMMDADSFEDWSFDGDDAIWRMDEGSFPYLAWEGDEAGDHSFPPSFMPPANLSAEVDDEDLAINLTWDEPTLGEPIGYKVYRNGEAINDGEMVDDEEFQDTDVDYFILYTYTVTAVYQDDLEQPESAHSNAVPIVILNFAGGDGTADSPYLVETPEHLYGVRFKLDGHYRQTDDIDLEEVEDWEPIGDTNNRFTGTYHGGHHIIGNLTIERNASYQGLFGYTEGADLRSIRLSNVNISATSYLGGLSGYIRTTDVDSCYVTGSISGTFYVGGISGYNWSSNISNSFTDGEIIATSAFSRVGGLLGYSSSNINVTNCYSTADITGNRERIGGLIGELGTGNVVNCYSTGTVTATDDNPDDIGGIIGRVGTGTATNSFWNLETSGQDETAGGGTGLTSNQMVRLGTFTGAGWDFEDVWDIDEGRTYPYLAWEEEPGDHVVPPAILPPSNLRFQLPDERDEVTILWDEPTILQPEGYHIYRDGERINQELIDDDEEFTDTNIQMWGFYVYAVTAVYEIDDEQIESERSSPLRVLIDDFAGGDGTADSPYLIANEVQLNGVRYMLDAHYRLTANIDLSRQPWDPIGDNNNQFEGVFDGNEFVMTEMNINTNESYQGLFGSVGSDGVLRDITLVDVNIQGGSYTGALAGDSRGDIRNCSATGAVSGGMYSGGLIGRISSGDIQDSWADVEVDGGNSNYIGGLYGYLNSANPRRCFALGDVTGNNYVGGFGGYEINATHYECFAAGDVTGNEYVGGFTGRTSIRRYYDCYAVGDVTGNNHVGGLVGHNRHEINRCYSIGRVTGQNNVGGLVGSHDADRAQYNASYWNERTSGQEESAGGEPRDERHMTYPYTDDTYVGWNFDNIWVADEEDLNGGYPYFTWQPLFMQPFPDVARNPNPANNVPNVAVDIDTLRWSYISSEAHVNPIGFRVYFNDSGEFGEDDEFAWVPYIIRQEHYSTGDILPEEDLDYLTTYFWKVVPTVTDPDDDDDDRSIENRRRLGLDSREVGITSRGDAENVPVWRFTTEINPHPASATDPIPKDEAEDVAIDLVNVGWTYTVDEEHTNPAGFRLYMNTTGEFEEDDDFVWVNFSQHQSNYTNAAILPEQLEYNRTYYWKVVPTTENPNRGGAESRERRAESSRNRTVSEYTRNDAEDVTVWSFTTIATDPNPQPATNPDPEHLATGISLGLPEVSWDYQPSEIFADPVGFRVYMNTTGAFGVNAPYIWVDYVEDQVTYSSSDILPLPLDANTTYYWRVIPTTIHPDDMRSLDDSRRRLNDKSSQRQSLSVRGDAQDCPVWRFTTGTTDIEDETVEPLVTELQKNYPNPFNPETNISFALAEASDVTIEVYNSRGQKVITLFDGYKESGRHTVVWNGRDSDNREVGSGIYFYRMKSGSYTATNRMVLLK